MFQIWVRQVSFFSGTQIFESEFRASLLPSSCLSTYSPVPSWGQGGHRMPELRLVAWLLGLAASKHSTALASSSHVWAGALCSRPGGRHTRLAARDRHISRWHPGSSGSVGLFQLKQLTCKNSSNCQILLVKKGFVLAELAVSGPQLRVFWMALVLETVIPISQSSGYVE